MKYASNYHVPVLLKHVLHSLITDPSGLYIDGTLGGGGHAEGILERLSTGGKLIGIDRDADAIAFSRKRLGRFGNQVLLRQANYDELEAVLRESGWSGVDGILLDLGISSFQLDEGRRGFSYLNPGPLDMRMDVSDRLSAFEVVNTYSYNDLKRIFKAYGEERQAGRIAMAILKARENESIRTTDELAQIVGRMVSPVHRNKVLSRIFQAIRIEVNQELNHLENALSQAVRVLKPGGRLVVISYHSLEDRLVKHFFRKMAQPCECPPELPICSCEEEPTLKILTRKPVEPTAEEKIRNPRSRSAKLRVAEKC
ncbi:MAG: 16S rRNA (cytosine(1402)-N(4))-methyltransferase RsmH [Calditrichaeota bacterium]|nr:16S rRNA (cytosine(1402)-N(4))-methyltransferase RsmH [Calditrichota bacterium]